MRIAIAVVVLFLANSAFANEYLFVGFEGQIYAMGDNGEVEKIASACLYRDGIEECMYSIDKGEVAVNILDMSRRLHQFGAESRLTGKYTMNIHRDSACFGLIYNHKEQTVAVDAMPWKSKDKRSRFIRSDHLSRDEKSTATISEIDSYLVIRTNTSLSVIPDGILDKEAFAKKHGKSGNRIRETGEEWWLSGQSIRWLCYGATTLDKQGHQVRGASWIKDRITGWEQVYTRTSEGVSIYVYPDVVLFKISTEENGRAYSSVPTGKYQVQLPGESSLREFEIDPAARHLWANSKSIFYQIDADVMRYDYTDAGSKPVKIWETSDYLFCMFEKDSILNALKE